MNDETDEVEDTVPGRNGGTLKPQKAGAKAINPNGRPKGSLNSKTIIKRWLSITQAVENELDPGKTEKLSNLDIAVIKQVVKAKSGDLNSLNGLLDRMEGRPKVYTELTGKDGTPIQPGETKHTVTFRNYSKKDVTDGQ